MYVSDSCMCLTFSIVNNFLCCVVQTLLCFNCKTMSKSGEILRIGRANYSFLCIHCGLNFYDPGSTINEILAHIEYHFDIVDSKVSCIDDTNALPGKDVRVNCSQTIEELAVEENLNFEITRTEFKIEDSRETKTELEEFTFDVKTLEDTKTVPVLPRVRRKRTSTTTKGKVTNKKERNELEEKESHIGDLDTSSNCKSCPICDLSFDNPTNCQSHLKDVHKMNSKVFQCYICGYFFKHFSGLERHIKSGRHSKTSCYQCESNPAVKNESDPRPHKCFLCKAWFENHVDFRKHFKDVHDKDVEKFFRKKSNCNEYTCFVCKKDFLHKYYLKNHMIIHNKMKAFVCDVCGNQYRTRAVLKRHSNVHEGKTYECPDCGKTFGYYARLRIHRYSHRTELNYKCTVCTKAFKVQKYLARHMKIHQDEKKYACTYCGKRFTFSTGRRAHELSQHNAI